MSAESFHLMMNTDLFPNLSRSLEKNAVSIQRSYSETGTENIVAIIFSPLWLSRTMCMVARPFQKHPRSSGLDF